MIKAIADLFSTLVGQTVSPLYDGAGTGPGRAAETVYRPKTPLH